MKYPLIMSHQLEVFDGGEWTPFGLPFRNKENALKEADKLHLDSGCTIRVNSSLTEDRSEEVWIKLGKALTALNKKKGDRTVITDACSMPGCYVKVRDQDYCNDHASMPIDDRQSLREANEIILKSMGQSGQTKRTTDKEIQVQS